MSKLIKTLQVRVKDKHAALLTRMSRNVNTTWNYCNEISQKAIRDRRQFLSGYDLNNLTAGFTHCDGVEIGSGTINIVCQEFAVRRKQFKRQRLNWRVSDAKSSKLLARVGSVQGRKHTIPCWPGGLRRPSFLALGQLWAGRLHTACRLVL